MKTAEIAPIPMTLDERDPDRFADALGASFARFGFAIVDEHGIPDAEIAATLRTVKGLFALPTEVKQGFRVPSGKGQRGYTPFGVETAKGAPESDLKEFWQIGREMTAPVDGDWAGLPNVWPDSAPEFRAHTLRLYESLERLGVRIVRAIARYVRIGEETLADAVTQGDSILRLLHYPSGPFVGGRLRAAAHEDINVITLLIGADEAGLEILMPSGEWLAIEAPPGSIVVNVGDMLARLTNDVLPSTTHRVVNPPPERQGVSRYSMPFFLHFRPDFVIATLPQCVSDTRPDRYPTAITAEAFLAERLRDIGLA